MARKFAKKFYRSQAWVSTRNAYFNLRHGLCERCKRKGIYTAGEIVHHIKPLTPANIDIPAIALGFDNLELLCRQCHADMHADKEPIEQRVAFDSEGNVVRKALN